MQEPALVCLFQCGRSNIYALTADHSGNNLPRADYPDGWTLRERFPLTPDQPRVGIDTVVALAGLDAAGYYIWRAVRISKTTKTRLHLPD